MNLFFIFYYLFLAKVKNVRFLRDNNNIKPFPSFLNNFAQFCNIFSNILLLEREEELLSTLTNIRPLMI